jgi:hypothetical protein
MDLSEDRPLAPETDSSNVSVTSEHTNSRKRKAVDDDDDDDDDHDGHDDNDDDDDQRE